MRYKAIIVLGAIASAITVTGLLARRGYIFPDLGSALNFFVHPDDIWQPLAESQVRTGVHEYELTAVHRYPGTHFVEISLPSQPTMEMHVQGLSLRVEAAGYPSIHALASKDALPFWGKREGVIVAIYNFPKDIDSRKPVHFRIHVDGDIDSLIHLYSDVRVSIVKGSDE